MGKRYIDPMKLKMSIAINHILNINKTLEEIIDDEPSVEGIFLTKEEYEELLEYKWKYEELCN